jgi:hypothetical protein
VFVSVSLRGLFKENPDALIKITRLSWLDGPGTKSLLQDADVSSHTLPPTFRILSPSKGKTACVAIANRSYSGRDLSRSPSSAIAKSSRPLLLHTSILPF